jgi:FHS family L-fucose permease-like MFS transporter
LQTAAALWIFQLGSITVAPRRFSFALAFNSLGNSLGPLIGRYWFSSSAAGGDFSNSALLISYLGIVLTLTVLFCFAARIPSARETNYAPEPRGRFWLAGALRHKHLVLGAAVMFCYVGAEICTGSLFTPFAMNTAHLSAAQAIPLLSFFWGGLMLGRVLLLPLLSGRWDLHVLATSAGVAMLLVIAAILCHGLLSVWLLVPLGLCNSVIVPILYERSIYGLGAATAQGGSILSAMIVGGAAFPLAMGRLADHIGIHYAFVLIVPSYLVIALFAILYRSFVRADVSPNTNIVEC